MKYACKLTQFLLMNYVIFYRKLGPKFLGNAATFWRYSEENTIEAANFLVKLANIRYVYVQYVWIN